jgi:phosphatidylglycerol:prolipoprotein diacylglycerol transferase
VFPPESAAGYFFPDTHIHPTQLYASLYGLVILLLLFILERFKTFEGFTFWMFILLYAISRSSIDFLRYYEHAMTIHVGSLAVSVNHIVSLGLFLTALFMLFRLSRNKDHETA